MSQEIECIHCGRKDFVTFRGLRQHQQSVKRCHDKLLASVRGHQQRPAIAHDFLPMTNVLKRKAVAFVLPSTSLATSNERMMSAEHEKTTAENPNKRQFAAPDSVLKQYTGEDEANDVFFETACEEVEPVSGQGGEDAQPDQSMRQNFKNYVAEQQNTLPFTKNELTALNLLATLRKTMSSLSTYETLMHWHLTSNGVIRSHQTVQQSPTFISREKIFKKLRFRYNHNESYLNTTKITLPHSKAKADIVWTDAKVAMQSLLTDPRITDDHYLFFEDDPLSSPPERINFIEDLNTGRACYKTYHHEIMRPGEQVLLPVIFYIDAANTGHFADLPVTALKMSLGIFHRKARENDYCWRILGHIPAVDKHKSKGRRLMLDSNHVDGVMAHQDALQDEGVEENDGICKAQDFHSMLKVILQSYVALQNSGFFWDLSYKGKMYRNIEFVLFTPFIKVDGEEADKLCGKYLTRTKNVAQLCRYCECPTNKSDDPKADYRLKTKKGILRMIAKNDLDALQKLSQHPIQNALYDIKFGRHNKQEIHGACPMEMLHALLLGLFKYTRDCFLNK